MSTLVQGGDKVPSNGCPFTVGGAIPGPEIWQGFVPQCGKLPYGAAAAAVRHGTLGAVRPCASIRGDVSRFLPVMQLVLHLPVRMHVKSQVQAQNGNFMIKNDGFFLLVLTLVTVDRVEIVLGA
jgi:hypothetical protein